MTDTNNDKQLVASGFFALRTPLLSFDELLAWAEGVEAPSKIGEADTDDAIEQAVARDRIRLRERMQALLSRPEVREALFVASPSLESRIDYWMQNPETKKGWRAEQALVRYLMRMAGRSTPFGLFAGCSVGEVGEQSALELAPLGRYRRQSRLDMNYLDALIQNLGSEATIRERLLYGPNTSLYASGDRLCYAEGRLRGGLRTYHLVALEATDYLEDTLQRAAGGATIESLANALASEDEEVSAEEATEFVHELVETQILVSDLTPVVTGPSAIEVLLDDLGPHQAAAPVAAALETTRDALQELDERGVGNSPTRYREIAGQLESLPVDVEVARLFQVDMYKPCDQASLSQAVIDEIARGVGLMHLASGPSAKDPLAGFAAEFSRRWESREVPLTRVLDEELGIGFSRKEAPSSEASPLLRGIDLPQVVERASENNPWSSRFAWLLEKLLEHEGSDSVELELGESELASMAAFPLLPLPEAFSVTAVVEAASSEALDQDDFRVIIIAALGPSGARMLGRFCYGDDRLREHVESHFRAEEALYPEAIFAEVVHLPQGRLGNILFRPVMRPYEIAYLGRSSVPPEFQIPIEDLRVSVREGRVVLRSAQLGKQIIPRLSSAHNFTFRSLSLYRVLCTLQGQGVTSGMTWNWGPLSGRRFLPRVVSGRAVLCPAMWQLQRADMKKLTDTRGAARFRAAQELREERRMPRWIYLADGDNKLPVDFDNVLSVETFVETIKRRGGAVLTEVYPHPDRLCVQGPEGRFANEVLVPFVRTSPLFPQPKEPSTTPEASSTIAERLPPGSDWLYVKLYTGASSSDQILRDLISPLTMELARSGSLDHWFFIRYTDPERHLRLRFHGDPQKLLGEVFPALQAAVAPLVADGRIWKLQLDTYEREIHRYGGPAGMLLAERVFHADSEALLEILRLFPGDEGADARWKLALPGIDRMLNDFGFDLEAKRSLLKRLREGFGKEFGVGKPIRIQLGNRFRPEQKNLRRLLESDGEETDDPLERGLAVFRARSDRLTPVMDELRQLSEDGGLSQTLEELAISHVHMLMNRLSRSVPRAQELVVYDFLSRLYESQAARARQTQRSS